MQDKKIFAAEVGGKTLKAQIIVLALLSIIGGIFIIQQKFANDSQVDLLQQEVIRLKNLSCQVELQKQKENARKL